VDSKHSLVRTKVHHMLNYIIVKNLSINQRSLALSCYPHQHPSADFCGCISSPLSHLNRLRAVLLPTEHTTFFLQESAAFRAAQYRLGVHGVEQHQACIQA
jgi:hypothetical protein